MIPLIVTLIQLVEEIPSIPLIPISDLGKQIPSTFNTIVSVQFLVVRSSRNLKVYFFLHKGKF